MARGRAWPTPDATRHRAARTARPAVTSGAEKSGAGRPGEFYVRTDNDGTTRFSGPTLSRQNLQLGLVRASSICMRRVADFGCYAGFEIPCRVPV